MNEHTMALRAPTASGARALFAAAAAAAALYLALQNLRPWPGDVVLKTTMCLLLATLAWRSQARLLTAALLCSAAGDAFLGVDGERLFVPGLASFLVTHVLYSALFVKLATHSGVAMNWLRTAAAGALTLFAAFYAAVLWPELGGLAAPVFVYLLAIVVMALLSLRLRGAAIAAGAFLFVASDSLIALEKFLWSAPWVGPAVWITYAAAQLLIVHGVLAATGGLAGSPVRSD